eukprot:Platyproteum_vivax@DN11232_c0_g1_i1.p1
MGGHGGLNILPQKSWHVWNPANKAKVLKDEREDAEKVRTSRKRVNEITLTENIKRLKESNDSSNHNGSISDVIHSAEPHHASSEAYPNSSGSKKTHFSDYDDSADYEKPQHLNLFEDIEKEMKKHAWKHEKYLRDVRHDKDAVPDMEQMKGDTPWYMQKQLPSEIRFQMHTKDEEIRQKRLEKINVLVEKCSKDDKKGDKDKDKKSKKKHKHKKQKSVDLNALRAERMKREKAENRRAENLQIGANWK